MAHRRERGLGADLREVPADGILADLPGGVGYLRVSDFTGLTPADTFAANKVAFDAARTSGSDRLRGLIVDLRVNGGAGSTFSEGEAFTQAMLNRSPRPVVIGENTQGVFSDMPAGEPSSAGRP